MTADTVEKKRETILVVDDSPHVLNFVVTVLQAAGFDILRADNGAQAIKLAGSHVGSIDLLLSDVEMSEMSGPDLGLALKESRPDLRVMLMSGMQNGNLLVLNYGWAFIEKPFVKNALLAMIDVVLQSPDRSQGSHQYDTRRDIGTAE